MPERYAKTKKSKQTHDRIIDAFIELMCHKDFDSISVKALTEKADINRGTFYLYFSDIYELTAEIETIILEDMPYKPSENQYPRKANSAPSYEECHDNMWERSWFEFYQSHAKYINTLLGPHGDKSFYNKIRKVLQNVLIYRMKQDKMPDDLLRSYFVNLMPDIFLIVAREWTDGRLEKVDIDSITNLISSIRVGNLYLHFLDLKVES